MSESPCYNILVIYCATEFPLRTAIHDHLYSFRRHSNHRVFYWNAAVRRTPEFLNQVSFDLIIFHTIFLGRWNRTAFRQIVKTVRPLQQLDVPKAAIPQDEFLGADLLVEFASEFGVDSLFVPSPPSEWPKIYQGLDLDRVRIHRVRRGYLEPRTLAKIDELSSNIRTRPIDIGYRAYRALPWLGRQGALKTQVGDAFLSAGAARNLRLDISTDQRDTLLGMSWFEFLLRCKYTIGVEGGSSILDRDGTIKARTEAYLRRHPEASFAEVEQACFPGQDGSLAMSGLTPRHLEACATKTCQILVQGRYDDVLKPGVHFIELKADFGNLDEVCRMVAADEVRDEIVEAAHADIVASGQFSFARFVEFVIAQSLSGAEPHDRRDESDAAYRQNQAEDRQDWKKVKRLSAVVRRIPTNIRGVGRVTSWLRRLYLMLR